MKSIQAWVSSNNAPQSIISDTLARQRGVLIDWSRKTTKAIKGDFLWCIWNTMSRILHVVACLLLCFIVAIASNTSGSSHLIHQLSEHQMITFKVATLFYIFFFQPWILCSLIKHWTSFRICLSFIPTATSYTLIFLTAAMMLCSPTISATTKIQIKQITKRSFTTTMLTNGWHSVLSKDYLTLAFHASAYSLQKQLVNSLLDQFEKTNSLK